MIETNKLHLGDNLDIMKSLPTESIDLIYADPPFNTGKNWGEFDDRWDSMSGYLDFMTTRIKEIHRLLKKTGSFYLHCDPTASHYLKVEVDKVFHIKNFRNEIVWEYNKFSYGQDTCFSKTHDIIMFYTKQIESIIFHRQWEEPTKEMLKEYERGYHSHGNFLTVFDKNNPKSKSLIQSGKYEKIYYVDIRKKSIGDVWYISPVIPTSKERVGYPTQKPITLLDRIIQASSDVGDIILDPFCGSGTTLVSANQLGRYYIGIDENPKAIQITEDRLKQLNLFTI